MSRGATARPRRGAGLLALVVVAIWPVTALVPASAQSDLPPPVALARLAELAEQSTADPVVAIFVASPESAGSFVADPVGDLVHPFGAEVTGSGPDLLSMQWFSVSGELLIPAFATLMATPDLAPDLIVEVPSDDWLPPPASTQLIAVVLDFNQPIPISLSAGCIPAVNVKHPGETTPTDRLRENDRAADTNGEYLFAAGPDDAPYALESLTNTPNFSTVQPETSLFGLILGAQAVFFIPAGDLADVTAIRASIDCFPGGSADGASRVSDLTDLLPFSATSMGELAFTQQSRVPAPTSTTTTTTAPTTTTVAPTPSTQPPEAATMGPAPAGEEPDGGGAGGWAGVVAGLTIAAAGFVGLRRAA